MKESAVVFKWLALAFFAWLASLLPTGFVAISLALKPTGKPDTGWELPFVMGVWFWSFIAFLWLFKRWAH